MNRNSFLHLLLCSLRPIVGGQAVLDGVMMRNGPMYSLAVRTPDGSIVAQRLPWRDVFFRGWLSAPFVRGFPILLDTLVNGIHALNLSAELASGPRRRSAAAERISAAFTLLLALVTAVVLFVAAPHLLSWCMLRLGFGGDLQNLSFHVWDGFYKCAIFMAYIWLISMAPDIRRVFQYHGAEHKTINAWETGSAVDPYLARRMSRLHPRCGTTFLLFVICFSVLVQAVCVPLALEVWAPEDALMRHAWILGIKTALVVPVSCVAYEIIRFAANLAPGPIAWILQAPGLALQRMTTREPDPEQVDVALAALAEALNPAERAEVLAPPYKILPLHKPDPEVQSWLICTD